MQLNFEATKSFCYKISRYTLLDLIAREPEAISGDPFKLLELTKRVAETLLTQQQLSTEIPAASADRTDTVFSTIKFFVALHAKRLPNSPFMWLGDGGMYRLKQAIDYEQEMEEVELEAEEDEFIDENTSHFDGWIYAFSFTDLIKEGKKYPIKIGKTISDVENRVAYQCKGSAFFDNPIILGKWQVKRVSQFEQAIHNILKVRGQWRENVPGTEWFNTTVEEIESLIKLIKV